MTQPAFSAVHGAKSLARTSMCVRCWAVYIILTVSRQLHKSHNSIHNARPDNSGYELLLFFFLFTTGDRLDCMRNLPVCVHKKTLPIIDRKGELALYHLRLHRSIYIHINSNASCPVTWTNRKNLCQILLYIDLTFWVLQLKSYLP